MATEEHPIGSSSSGSSQDIALVPRSSHASRNLLVGALDSEDEQEPTKATSDQVLNLKEFRGHNEIHPVSKHSSEILHESESRDKVLAHEIVDHPEGGSKAADFLVENGKDHTSAEAPSLLHKSSQDDVVNLGIHQVAAHSQALELESPLASDYQQRRTSAISNMTANDNDFVARAIGGSTSPSPRKDERLTDSGLDSNKYSNSSASEMRSFLVEKEVMESKMRQMQNESSGLKSQNTLLEEKVSRSQARCHYLEAQLRLAHEDASKLKDTHQDELSLARHRSHDRSSRDYSDMEAQLSRLTRDINILKTENALMEKQLATASSSRPTHVSSPAHDWSKITESYQVENSSLKAELTKVRDLLQSSEHQMRAESSRRQEASLQVVRLTEMKALLQQQLETRGGSTAAEKQLQSIERRLRITEDRLHQERADRARKLSEVEEKLITDNAKLQVSDKEHKRCLMREQDKTKQLQDKYQDVRNQNEQLRLDGLEKPAIFDSISYKSKMSSIRTTLGGKKHADEIKFILDLVKKEDNLGQGQENDIIWLLWHQKEEVAKQLKEWEVSLRNLDIDHSNVQEGLKMLQKEHIALKSEIDKYKEALEDTNQENDQLRHSYSQHVETLTREKHTSLSRAKDLEDLNAAITAENDSLRTGLQVSAAEQCNALWSTEKVQHWEAKIESLKAELLTTQADLSQAIRSQTIAESQVGSLQTQLAARDQAVAQAVREVERLQGATLGQTAGADDWKQQRIEKLHSELAGYQQEADDWRQKYTEAEAARRQLEDETEDLLKHKNISQSQSANAAAPELESDKLALDSALHEKDLCIVQLTISNNETEDKLKRCTESHRVEEQRNKDILNQLDQLQAQLRQKTRLMEKMSNAESDYQVELRVLKENLSLVNRDLSVKNQQVKQKTVDLEREHAKVNKLQTDLNYREELLSQDIAGLVHQGTLTSAVYRDTSASPRESLTQAEARMRVLEYEKEALTHDIQRANMSIEAVVAENSELLARLHDIKQELTKDRAQLCQITCGKAELEQTNHVIQEERDAATRQRSLLEQDLGKQEADLKQMIEKLENDKQQATLEYQHSYHVLDSQGKKLVVELGTSQRLVEAREKEIDTLRDTVFRQKQEINMLQRQVSVVAEENAISRENVDKLTSELTLRLKEHSVSSGTQQSLSSEKTKLQLEKYHLQQQLVQAHTEVERQVRELSELKVKLGNTEDSVQALSQELHNTENKAISLETTLKSSQQTCGTMETETMETKALAERLSMEIRGLLLASDTRRVFEEKSFNNRLRDDLTNALHQVELVKQEHTLRSSNLTADRKTIETLKEQCQGEERKVTRLDDTLKLKELELDTVRVHLQEQKNATDQYKKDKNSLYQDIQDLIRKLSEKDETIVTLQERLSRTMDSVQKEHSSQTAHLSREKIQLEAELSKIREELEELKDNLRQKEVQLEVYYRTSRELQDESKARLNIEAQSAQLKSDLTQANWQNNGLQTEVTRLQDKLLQIQVDLDKQLAVSEELSEQLEVRQTQHSREVKELNLLLKEYTHKADIEKENLKDLLFKTQADYRATEAAVSAATESKQTLHSRTVELQQLTETLRTQVHEEVTARKLSEQRADNQQSQLEQERHLKISAEDKTSELLQQLTRVESDLSIERDKFRRLKQELTDTKSSRVSHEQQSHSLLLQISELSAEVSTLQNQLEYAKQNLGGKNKKLLLELKQQGDDSDKERAKLHHETQQLSRDLEESRQMAATKNREVLRLREESLTQVEQVQETRHQLRQSQDGLSGEQTEKKGLELRNMELELLVAKLRSKESDDSFETSRLEVTRMLTDVTQRMQTQLDSQRGCDSEARTRDTKRIDDLKTKVSALESTLTKEQGGHILTRSQLSSLEDDNQLLRQQLQAARKRLSHSSDTERSKSRLEEINEIIARSQTRAQQLIASGAYGEDPLKTLNAAANQEFFSNTTDFSLQSPRANVRTSHEGSPPLYNGSPTSIYTQKKL